MFTACPVCGSTGIQTYGCCSTECYKKTLNARSSPIQAGWPNVEDPSRFGVVPITISLPLVAVRRTPEELYGRLIQELKKKGHYSDEILYLIIESELENVPSQYENEYMATMHETINCIIRTEFLSELQNIALCSAIRSFVSHLSIDKIDSVLSELLEDGPRSTSGDAEHEIIKMIYRKFSAVPPIGREFPHIVAALQPRVLAYLNPYVLSQHRLGSTTNNAVAILALLNKADEVLDRLVSMPNLSWLLKSIYKKVQDAKNEWVKKGSVDSISIKYLDDFLEAYQPSKLVR